MVLGPQAAVRYRTAENIGLIHRYTRDPCSSDVRVSSELLPGPCTVISGPNHAVTLLPCPTLGTKFKTLLTDPSIPGTPDVDL